MPFLNQFLALFLSRRSGQLLISLLFLLVPLAIEKTFIVVINLLLKLKKLKNIMNAYISNKFIKGI
jgi:hypothetical protein